MPPHSILFFRLIHCSLRLIRFAQLTSKFRHQMHWLFDVGNSDDGMLCCSFYKENSRHRIAGHVNCFKPTDVCQFLLLSIMTTFEKKEDLNNSSLCHCIACRTPRGRLVLDKHSVMAEKGVCIDSNTCHQVGGWNDIFRRKRSVD